MRRTGRAAFVAMVVVTLGASAGCVKPVEVAKASSDSDLLAAQTAPPPCDMGGGKLLLGVAPAACQVLRAGARRRAALAAEATRLKLLSEPRCSSDDFDGCKAQCAVDRGESCLALSEMYRTGRGTEKSEAKMHESFERGCHTDWRAGACCDVSAAQRAAGIERSLASITCPATSPCYTRFEVVWGSCRLRCASYHHVPQGINPAYASKSDVDACIEMADMENKGTQPTSVWRQTPEYRLNLYKKLRPICRVFAIDTACAVANAPEFKKLTDEDDASIQRARAIQDKVDVARRVEELRNTETARQNQLEIAKKLRELDLRELLSKNQPTNPPTPAKSTIPPTTVAETPRMAQIRSEVEVIDRQNAMDQTDARDTPRAIKGSPTSYRDSKGNTHYGEVGGGMASPSDVYRISAARQRIAERLKKRAELEAEYERLAKGK